MWHASGRAVFVRTALALSTYCLLGLGAFSLGTPRAVAQKVKIDFDRTFDFSTLKTYAWKIHPAMKDNLELRESVGAELVRMAVSRELLDRGFVPTEEEFADFYVTGFGTRGRRSEITGGIGGWYSSGPYYMQGWETVMVRNYMEGTLILDIVDAKTKQLAWRAYCKGAVSNPSKRDKVVDKALKKALKNFPPKL
jgi:hypothetical protein